MLIYRHTKNRKKKYILSSELFALKIFSLTILWNETQEYTVPSITIFQLLDRDVNGKSEYGIKADADLRAFLEEKLGEDNKE